MGGPPRGLPYKGELLGIIYVPVFYFIPRFPSSRRHTDMRAGDRMMERQPFVGVLHTSCPGMARTALSRPPDPPKMGYSNQDHTKIYVEGFYGAAKQRLAEIVLMSQCATIATQRKRTREKVEGGRGTAVAVKQRRPLECSSDLP